MSDPFLNIPEPSLPEHNLLREAGQLPRLTPGLRDRVLADCHSQLRNGRIADRIRVMASVIVACLLVFMVWNCRWSGPPAPKTSTIPRNTASPQAPSATYPYSSRGIVSEDAAPEVDTDSDGKPLPEGGPSLRRQSIPEMRQLDQMIEKLQNRQNVLCGLLPYL